MASKKKDLKEQLLSAVAGSANTPAPPRGGKTAAVRSAEQQRQGVLNRLEAVEAERDQLAEQVKQLERAREELERLRASGDGEAVRALEARIGELNKQVEKGGVMIDPNRIRHSVFAQRLDLAWDDPEYQDLKKSIKTVGFIGAILVRPVEDDQEHEYEVVFGHRRQRAAQELGVPVRAIVSDISDREMLQFMEMENRGRKDPSPYELGLWYAKWIERGVVKNADEASKLAGISNSTMSRLLGLASLPESVVGVFADPREVRLRWATDLVRAYKLRPDHVLAEVERIIKLERRLPAEEVFNRLVSEQSPSPTVPRQKVSEKRIVRTGHGSLIFTAKVTDDGRLTIAFNKKVPSSLTEKALTEIEELAKRLAKEEGWE